VTTVRTLTLTAWRLNRIDDETARAEYWAWARAEVDWSPLKVTDYVELEVLDESGRWLALTSRHNGAVHGAWVNVPFPSSMLPHLEWVDHEDTPERRRVLDLVRPNQPTDTGRPGRLG
jgi:hypothetical protein